MGIVLPVINSMHTQEGLNKHLNCGERLLGLAATYKRLQVDQPGFNREELLEALRAETLSGPQARGQIGGVIPCTL